MQTKPRQVHISCPVCVELSLRTDGSIELWNILWREKYGHYAHVKTGMNSGDLSTRTYRSTTHHDSALVGRR